MSELVSIIVPVYKVEQYLSRCVDSILQQSYSNLEIILVDDGSPDSCGMICDEYQKKDSRVQVIHKSNGGLSDARNYGIEAAQGKYLAFVDSDDWLDFDMIDILYRVLTSQDADIAECSYRNLYADCVKEETSCSGEIICGNNLFALEGMLDWKYFKPNAWNKLYKREVIGDIRYPKGKIHEDEYTTYKYFYNAKKLAYVDISKYNYDCRRTDSITGDKFREANLDACWAFKERVLFFEENHLNSLEEKMNNAYCWQVLHCAYRCYKEQIAGRRVDELVSMAKQDIPYLKKHKVYPWYITEFEMLQHGVDYYGNKRQARENS